MLVVSLRDVNFGFWSHLGCSGQNAIICSREGPLGPLGLRAKKNDILYLLRIYFKFFLFTLLGVKKKPLAL